MKCLIISGGDIKTYGFYKHIISDSDIIICADKGAELMYRFGKLPDYIIGDLDSISEEALNFFIDNNVSIEKYPVKKNESDTELAIDKAIELKPEKITIIGATGSRLDHTIASVFLLIKPLNAGIPSTIVDEHNEIYLVSEKLKLNGTQDEFISVIPVTNEIKGVDISGFEYPVEDGIISFGSSLGISNRFKGHSGTISLSEGLLLVIKSRD